MKACDKGVVYHYQPTHYVLYSVMYIYTHREIQVEIVEYKIEEYISVCTIVFCTAVLLFALYCNVNIRQIKGRITTIMVRIVYYVH